MTRLLGAFRGSDSAKYSGKWLKRVLKAVRSCGPTEGLPLWQARIQGRTGLPFWQSRNSLHCSPQRLASCNPCNESGRRLGFPVKNSLHSLHAPPTLAFSAKMHCSAVGASLSFFAGLVSAKEADKRLPGECTHPVGRRHPKRLRQVQEGRWRAKRPGDSGCSTLCHYRLRLIAAEPQPNSPRRPQRGARRSEAGHYETRQLLLVCLQGLPATFCRLVGTEVS
jgi:hypothetical protein